MKDTALKLLAEGMAAVEVAEQLGVPAATVRSWKRRAYETPAPKPKAKKAKVSRAKAEPPAVAALMQDPEPAKRIVQVGVDRFVRVYEDAPTAPTLPTVTPEPPEDTKPPEDTTKPTRRHWRAVMLDVVLLLVIGGHSLLAWYDCSTQWGTPGFIGGGVTFLIVVASVLLATDRDQYSTSEVATWFVLLIDVGAWFVHVPTFMQESSIGKTETQVFSWFLVGCAWFALYLFRSSKNN